MTYALFYAITYGYLFFLSLNPTARKEHLMERNLLDAWIFGLNGLIIILLVATGSFPYPTMKIPLFAIGTAETFIGMISLMAYLRRSA